MDDRVSPLLISILGIGIAILYIPILVLIGYSFNASALVSVWGGFSTRWYTQLIAQRPDPRCGVAVVADWRRGLDRRGDSRHPRRHLAGAASSGFAVGCCSRVW